MSSPSLWTDPNTASSPTVSTATASTTTAATATTPAMSTYTRPQDPSEPATVRYPHPPLTPQFCFSTRTLKDFLRLSRSTIDDTISQNLNALHTPASHTFDPSSTSRISRPTSSTLPATSCQNFVTNVLMPSWQSRSDVLNYCASVATSEDPDDPDSLERLSQLQSDRERVVDERLDPYSGRFFPKESRTEELAGLVRNERMVEKIVRDRTWRIVRERCGDEGARGDEWESAMEIWRAAKGR